MSEKEKMKNKTNVLIDSEENLNVDAILQGLVRAKHDALSEYGKARIQNGIQLIIKLNNLSAIIDKIGDLIDRHEAIKIITSYDGVVDKSVAKKLLFQMKSAQQYMTATSNTMLSDTVKIPVMDGTTERLPSVQPEPICINLNEPIKVKLNDWGKEIYYHKYDRINQIAGREICKPRFPREDENGYTEFQLWYFIELYGEHIGMTLPNVIEPLEIVYER